MSDTIKEQVYAMKTPEILSKAKNILKENKIRGWNFKMGKYIIKDKIKSLKMDLAILEEGEYRKDLTDLFGTTNIDID